MDEVFGVLLRKLYEADEDMGYLEELEVEKLIEFVIVGHMGMMVGVVWSRRCGMRTRRRI